MSVGRGGCCLIDNGAELPCGVLPLTPQEAAGLFDEIDLTAEHRVDIFITAPFIQVTDIHEADDPALSGPDARSPRRRIIYERGILNDRNVVRALQNALTVDTDIRVAATLPYKLILADGRHALMSRTPINDDDPRILQYVQEPTLVRAITVAFAQVWNARETLAFDPDRGVYDDRIPPMGERDYLVYRELISGATLDSIAHTVNASVSTVQRTLTHLYQLAGVSNRVEFVRYATQHWN